MSVFTCGLLWTRVEAQATWGLQILLETLEGGVVERVQPVEDHHVALVLGEWLAALALHVTDGEWQVGGGALLDDAQHGGIGAGAGHSEVLLDRRL